MSTANDLKVIALVPAYNEASSIELTIKSLLSQTTPFDQIIIIPNGCTDNTAEIARQYPVTVFELPPLFHRKSEAMNRGWIKFGQSADIVVTVDADTILANNAVTDWKQEFLSVKNFGGSTSKFTVQQPGFFGRMQKAEYAMNIQQGLNRGWTNVLAGAGSAFSGVALKTIASRSDREGPWSYTSAVEDYEITYRLRELGLVTYISETIRAYTDGMNNLKSLWGQRIKWQAGTIQDLIAFGFNKSTCHDWFFQAVALLNPLIRILWILVLGLALYTNSLIIVWWAFLIPLLTVALSIKSALRIPHRDKWDMFLAVILIPTEMIHTVRGGWILRSWFEVLYNTITRKKRDLWSAQYKAEGV